MTREEVMNTLRIYFERQIFGKGLIPSQKAVVKNWTGWESFKFQFDEETLQILKNEVLEIRYEDISGIKYFSKDDEATIHMFLKRQCPLTFKTPLRSKWYHFSSTSSVMKKRWGDLEVGTYLFSKGEVAIGDGPLLVFTRKPFDFDLSGDCVVLKDNERWLGYLIKDENAYVYASKNEKPIVKRTLDIEGFRGKNAVVKECIDFYFKDEEWYRSTTYFDIDTRKF